MNPTITDWLMVAITAIYVVATICITKSNRDTAEATKKQLIENKTQYEEMRRYSNLPFLQFEINGKKDQPVVHEFELTTSISSHREIFGQSGILRNIGNGTAMNIVYSWQSEALDAPNTDCFSVNAIRHGDSYKVELITEQTKDNEVAKGVLTFNYQDLLGNEYEQKMYFSFQNYDMTIDTDTPMLCNMPNHSENGNNKK